MKRRRITGRKQHYLRAFADEDTIKDSITDFLTVISATHQKAISQDVTARKDPDHMDFENVLIDEAARSCPPDLLIPLSCARDRMILVGDHKQLPQFVCDKVFDSIDDVAEADKQSIIKDESMFLHLIKQVKKLESNDGIPRFIRLDAQYRMPQTLGDLVSRQFYDGELTSPLGNDPACFDTNLKYIRGLHLSLKQMQPQRPRSTIYDLRAISGVCFQTETWIFDLFHGPNGRDEVEGIIENIIATLYDRDCLSERNPQDKYNPRKIRDVLELLLCICRLKAEDPSILDCNEQRTKLLVKQLKKIDSDIRKMGEDGRLMLERKIEALNNKMLTLVNESVSSGDGIEAHESEFMTLSQEAELLKQRIAAIQESTAKDNGEQSRLEQIQAIISERESKCMKYDDSIVRQMVECIKVYPGGKLEIIFGGGYLVEESV